jgi:hypothetical protein
VLGATEIAAPRIGLGATGREALRASPADSIVDAQPETTSTVGVIRATTELVSGVRPVVCSSGLGRVVCTRGASANVSRPTESVVTTVDRGALAGVYSKVLDISVSDVACGRRLGARLRVVEPPQPDRGGRYA